MGKMKLVYMRNLFSRVKDLSSRLSYVPNPVKNCIDEQKFKREENEPLIFSNGTSLSIAVSDQRCKFTKTKK